MAEEIPPKALKLPTSSHNTHPDLALAQSRLLKPARDGFGRLKAYILAVNTFKHGQDFSAKPSRYKRRQATATSEEEGQIGPSINTLYVGISAVFADSKAAVIAIAIRDAVYLLDFSVKQLELDGPPEKRQDVVTEYIINNLECYEKKIFCKFLGAGVPDALTKMAPKLCSRLWSELDIVPISISPDQEIYGSESKATSHWNIKCVDEQADSMARKCIMFFGPSQSPLLQVGYRGLVEIDASSHVHMCNIEDYQATCGNKTWDSMMKYATSLKKREIKIAFFSSTPQGGGVALMRHALVRFARVMGVNLTWYVPKPKPGVFRITKNIHNILQGVANTSERISSSDKTSITDWIEDNANRYWLSEGGPLRNPSEGGADVIIIDDPQMPGLIPLAKKACPNRAVLYRSHIQIRSDLVKNEGSPQADIWNFLWRNIQHADMFISHPVPSFVPKNVPRSTVAYLPAATDWLDGLNKSMSDWDKAFYFQVYNLQCLSTETTPLKRTSGKYFIQVARFDPSKGILDVIKSFAEFHRLLEEKSGRQDLDDIPQLLIVGNGSIDDPDASRIYDEAMRYLETHASHLEPLVSIMRLQPNDQLLNTLLSNAHTVLQLSTREGFEVKVSEALHKARPVIATRTGGIPTQVQDGKNGFLVNPGDWKAVGAKLLLLWTDHDLYRDMSAYAAGSVSDEIGTVGNALAWFYLADEWTGGRAVLRPEERWVNELARDQAGFPYMQGENRLPRTSTLMC